jgi:hypothetical protein
VGLVEAWLPRPDAVDDGITARLGEMRRRSIPAAAVPADLLEARFEVGRVADHRAAQALSGEEQTADVEAHLCADCEAVGNDALRLHCLDALSEHIAAKGPGLRRLPGGAIRGRPGLSSRP